MALTQWTRSAAQRNVDALVKVGDYYYFGLGVPEEHESTRYEKAAGYYQSAADTQMSALAMWNLGWMYENGKGVPMDFHLAKRHYDLALETNSEAYLPVTLALIKLHVKSLYYILTGGPEGLNLFRTTNEDREIFYAERGDQDSGRSQEEGDQAHGSDNEIQDDGPWYLGKAKDEFNRRQRGEANGAEDDPVQVRDELVMTIST